MPTGHFTKWALDFKKHAKRRTFWLPNVKNLARGIIPARTPRYLTLCASEMIDVFMLVREEILSYSAERGVIEHVRFCEMDEEIFPEIKELIGLEDSGFPEKLEDLALFEDDDFSAAHADPDAIAEALQDEGLERGRRDKLTLKRRHLQFQASFPYDLINLDFCDYYYPRPPDVLRINATVGKLLAWQRQPLDDGSHLGKFLLFVTCKHDEGLPQEAIERLKAIVKANVADIQEYRTRLEARDVQDVDQWAMRNRDDFFLSVWPKDIAELAASLGWTTTILGYPFYDRVGDRDNPYKIACLVLQFDRQAATAHVPTVPTALHALDPENRTLISEIPADSPDGVKIRNELNAIVELRNAQAQRKMRPLMPVA